MLLNSTDGLSRGHDVVTTGAPITQVLLVMKPWAICLMLLVGYRWQTGTKVRSLLLQFTVKPPAWLNKVEKVEILETGIKVVI